MQSFLVCCKILHYMLAGSRIEVNVELFNLNFIGLFKSLKWQESSYFCIHRGADQRLKIQELSQH